ncbi:MAG: hypothetical protein ACM3O7_03145 [Acidobacteriota bacterium]
MTKRSRLMSAASAFLLTLPLGAAAAPLRQQPEQHARGYVIWATPVSFAIDTGTTFRTFLIPPGAEFTDQLFPGAKVSVGWVYEPQGKGRATVEVVKSARTARPTSHLADAARPAREEQMIGTVAFITPDDLALENPQGIELFALTPHWKLPDRLAEGDYVQLFYRVEPTTGNKIINRVTASSANAATARMVTTRARVPVARMMRPHSAKGEIAFATPDRLVLATSHGLEDFTILHSSRLRDLGVGDYVRLTYRRLPAHGPRFAMARSPNTIAVSSAS